MSRVFGFLERRLHPVLVTAAIATGVGATATYQWKRTQSPKPLIMHPDEIEDDMHLAPKSYISQNHPREKLPVLETPKISNPSVQDQDGSPIAEGLGVYHKSEADSNSKTATIFSLEEVSKHNREGDIWVTYQGGVYDVSEFVPSHPGGQKILLAAGKSLEPFWSMYRVHITPEVREILEEYRIGSLSPNECQPTVDSTSNPFIEDPDRSAKKLTVRTTQPFNAEAPLDVLSDYDITPIENFFVRNHLPVPQIDPNIYELKISGEGVTEKSLTLQQLKQFPKHSVRSTIQCAGNGRSAMDAVKSVRGLQWGYGAISTAEWSGARLIDVLNACDYKPSENGQHVLFEGFDRDMTQAYGASIPIEKATDPRAEVILAYEMNGTDIPRDNGYPVRVIVPGVVGARNVKWLKEIKVDDSESESHWQQKDYKGFSPSSDWDNLDWSKQESIQELPVISAICSPEPGKFISPGTDIEVKGYAYSGGGRAIIRVDVSADGGKSWTVADLNETSPSERNHWAARRWNAKVSIPADAKGKIELVCKAVDRSYNTQPENFESIYNARGVLCNAWHRVEVQCQ